MREEKELRLFLWSYDLPEPYYTQFWNIVANGSLDHTESHYSKEQLEELIYHRVRNKYPDDPWAGSIYKAKAKAKAKPKISDNSRCAVCGWPLKETIDEGCVVGNCSMRPLPDIPYDRDRAIANGYSRYSNEICRFHGGGGTAEDCKICLLE